MTPSEVGAGVLVVVGVVGVLCLLGAVVFQAGWTRGRQGLWPVFWLGALTFAVTQLVIRIPMVTVVLPKLPEWQALLRQGMLAALVLGFVTAVLAETGRLLVMSSIMRPQRHSHRGGVSFGLGYGGAEAAIGVGLNLIWVLLLGIMVRAGQWEGITAGLAPEAAAAVQGQLSGVTVVGVLAGGLERVFLIAFQVALSVWVLLGVVRDTPAKAWGTAVLIHGTVNFVAGAALTVWAWPVLAVQVLLGVVAVAAVLWVVRAQRKFLALTPVPQPTR